jgi:hypothetical protein
MLRSSIAFSLLFVSLVGAAAHSQSALESHTAGPQEGAQSPAHGGSSTAGVFKPNYDSSNRPITAGGTVKTGPHVFQNVAGAAGLSKWKHVMGSPEKLYLLDTIGSGVALLDFDGDGWIDIYLVNGSTREAMGGKSPAPRAALFHNNHDGTFTDVAAKAGVTNERWGFGAVVGDFDNDGHPDIYVSNFGSNRLYRNNGDGTFTDVAEKAGVTLGNWSTGATWGDYDGDGKLDLFVPGYVHWDEKNLPDAGVGGVTYSFCTYRGVRVLCGPHGLHGEKDHLFHNNGDGTFTDVSDKAGVADKPGYYGLSSAFVDINNDGKPDLLVANDSTPNYLYLNRGDGTFEDASYASGYALNKEGRETAAMGIAIGDQRHTGNLDVFHTTFSDDYKPLYENDGKANFTDISYDAAYAELTIPFLGWGTAFLDFDNDGWQDLLTVNGHVYRNADVNRWGTSWAERPLLFRNDDGRKLEPVPAVEGTALAEVFAARGLAVGDLFNDGRMDAVINNMDGPPALLRNTAKSSGNWLGIVLVGRAPDNADGIGASVYVRTGTTRQRVDRFAGGSFASSSDPRLHFGLGTATRVDDLEVHWPSGRSEHFPVAGVNTYLTLHEGEGTTGTVARSK